jgi:hypothetical protein
MNANAANTVIARLAGYWPTPAMTDEEALAWVEVLTSPDPFGTGRRGDRSITLDEARRWLSRRLGDQFRPRPGQLVEWVRAERRSAQRVLTPPRPAPEVVAARIAEIRKLIDRPCPPAMSSPSSSPAPPAEGKERPL